MDIFGLIVIVLGITGFVFFLSRFNKGVMGLPSALFCGTACLIFMAVFAAYVFPML